MKAAKAGIGAAQKTASRPEGSPDVLKGKKLPPQKMPGPWYNIPDKQQNSEEYTFRKRTHDLLMKGIADDQKKKQLKAQFAKQVSKEREGRGLER